MTLKHRTSLALKALGELGLRQMSLYALYRLQLHSGYLRRQTSDDRRFTNLPDACFRLFPLMELPDPDHLCSILGGAGCGALLSEADEILAGRVRLFGGDCRVDRRKVVVANRPESADVQCARCALPQNLDVATQEAITRNDSTTALIDHLILKGAYLAMVSTSPNGVALGEDLLQKISAQNGFRYQEISQYANLGYISGGSTGLLGFAETPRQITPNAVVVNSTYVWGQAPLQRVQTISDFDLVAVLTENADKARAWIEQVQPKMESIPLVMVLSAQAEPMVRPYYQSNPKLVAGIVAGLVGGGSYESTHPDLLRGIGPARRYWDAFSLSMFVVLGLIAVGIVVDLSLSAVKNRKGDEGGKAP